MAGSCNFQKKKQLQISDATGAQKFKYVPKFHENGGFQHQILHVWTKNFGHKIFFRTANDILKETNPATVPLVVEKP